jgi:hypothetical protein
MALRYESGTSAVFSWKISRVALLKEIYVFFPAKIGIKHALALSLFIALYLPFTPTMNTFSQFSFTLSLFLPPPSQMNRLLTHFRSEHVSSVSSHFRPAWQPASSEPSPQSSSPSHLRHRIRGTGHSYTLKKDTGHGLTGTRILVTGDIHTGHSSEVFVTAPS